MNQWVLDIIRCPITGQPLEMAGAELVEQLRARSASGDLLSHKGIAIQPGFEAGLVDKSHTYFYRIQDGIPSLLPDEAIAL